MDIYFSRNRNPLSQAHQTQPTVKTKFFIGQPYGAGQTVSLGRETVTWSISEGLSPSIDSSTDFLHYFCDLLFSGISSCKFEEFNLGKAQGILKVFIIYKSCAKKGQEKSRWDKNYIHFTTVWLVGIINTSQVLIRYILLEWT